MISARASKDKEESRAFDHDPRGERDNLAWLLPKLDKPRKGTQCHVVLVGGNDPLSVRMRVAQSHLRNDVTPSHWSHVLLAMPTRAGLDYRHIPLSTEHGFSFPPITNGVQPASIDHYADAARYPNVAVIHVPDRPMEADKRSEAAPTTSRRGESDIQTACIEFEYSRGSLDAVELIWAWMGFAWGAAKSGNPLLNGVGIPCAVFVEQVLAAVRVDITPGLASRASCPEAIWQAARWWHSYYRKARDMVLPGSYCVDHRIVPNTFESTSRVSATTPAAAPARARRSREAR
jgi:hypothetical protein